ncbi:MAG: hypothetical protein A9Z00_08425 [Thermobacillus sp. ZCTH02-B1]|uniref:ABC transporter substrate-binding protein n=1 Tax=Thermobacillus sp. ZCTH02-B1 TaxID=1858795 RepID=UPI000B574585|nr:extracellular solute-binding protein [Thermobacillus sp. ZCTH02-B1]OUM95369.1 MAG: hypothetical protein A9Z00_08425 [Thermobacillus sp. ZCTH02-B1]
MNRSANRAVIRLRRWIAAALAMSLLLSACSKGGSGKESAGEPATIKVLYWSDQSFQMEYGMLFYATHPDIEIQVVNTNAIQSGEGDYNEKLDELIRKEKPDILLLSQDQYEKYAADGRLVSLESYITRDKFDLEGFVPGMVELLREKGGGELYGLAPRFYSQAVYYNKDLFDRFGIEYPTDRMSWEELLNLAARFPTDGEGEDRVFGLYMMYAPSGVQPLAQQIGLTHGLRVLNPADKRVSLDTDSWARVYETAVKAVRSGALYKEDPASFTGEIVYQDYLLRDPFIGGKAAMAIGPMYLLIQIREASGMLPDKAVNNWDLVTVPVDPANPDYSPDMNFYDVFAINAESTNPDAAWKFIRYVHSDEFARVVSKSFMGQFPTRTKYIQDEEGRNLAAFYALKPSGANLYEGADDLPGDFYMQFDFIGNEEMQAVLNDEKTVREALASMQTRLQAVIDGAAENPASGPNAFEFPGSGEVSEGSGSASGSAASVPEDAEPVPADAESVPDRADAGAAGEGSAE